MADVAAGHSLRVVAPLDLAPQGPLVRVALLAPAREAAAAAGTATASSSPRDRRHQQHQLAASPPGLVGFESAAHESRSTSTHHDRRSGLLVRLLACSTSSSSSSHVSIDNSRAILTTATSHQAPGDRHSPAHSLRTRERAIVARHLVRALDLTAGCSTIRSGASSCSSSARAFVVRDPQFAPTRRARERSRSGSAAATLQVSHERHRALFESAPEARQEGRGQAASADDHHAGIGSFAQSVGF